MGVVHLAQGPDGRRVALKVLRPHIVGDVEARERLAREVSSLQRITSPRIAEILDADPHGPVPYVVTRYVPGLSLYHHVAEEGPVEGRDLLHFAGSLAQALLAVHSVGVLHRDVKPTNVLMEGRSPVLIDFGLARVAEDPRLTQTGWLLGTPGYLAPEILYGDDATVASDVHAWGATVVFAATGRPPYGTGPVMAIMDRVRRGEHDVSGVPAPLRDLLRECPLRRAAGASQRPRAARLGRRRAPPDRAGLRGTCVGHTARGPVDDAVRTAGAHGGAARPHHRTAVGPARRHTIGSQARGARPRGRAPRDAATAARPGAPAGRRSAATSDAADAGTSAPERISGAAEHRAGPLRVRHPAHPAAPEPRGADQRRHRLRAVRRDGGGGHLRAPAPHRLGDPAAARPPTADPRPAPLVRRPEDHPGDADLPAARVVRRAGARAGRRSGGSGHVLGGLPVRPACHDGDGAGGCWASPSRSGGGRDPGACARSSEAR